MKLLDIEGLTYFINKIKLMIAGKVDKEPGKGLSANNYTDIDKTEVAKIKDKLTKSQVEQTKVNEAKNADTVSGKTVKVNVPEGAKFTDTIYTHPPSHPASMIIETTTRRFVTDAEKSTWSAKETPGGAQTKATKALTDSKTYINDKVKTDVPSGAKFTDTVYTHPANHPASMITESSTKRFVTDTEKNNWNSKETTSGAQAKATKALTDSKEYIDNKVKTDVPLNAKFTDTNTIYTHPKTHPYSMITGTPDKLPADGGQSTSTKHLVGDDTRSHDYPPSTYMSGGSRFEGRAGWQTEFKSITTIKVSGFSGTYVYMQTLTPWTDPSGGYPIQVVYGNGIPVWRVGISRTSWSEWHKVNDGGDAATVNGKTVLSNVPTGAKFTDTITTINGKTGAILKSDIEALGISAVGPKGDKGDTGPRGPQGPKGDTGARGPQGIQGIQGPKGAVGAKGADSTVPGPKGDTGVRGPQGLKGETGPQGPQGLKGNTGTPGAKGDKGDTGPRGLQGPKGETGQQGPRGLTGAASTVAGPKGDKGDTGPRGLQGVKGDTGAQGPRGYTGAASTVPGPKGATGAQGPKGDKGDTGPQGPRGHTGATGSQGPKGDTGAQGATGPRGGTGPTGPKGDKGDTGSRGPQGPKGDTGARGPQGIQGIQGIRGATGAAGLTTTVRLNGTNYNQSGGTITLPSLASSSHTHSTAQITDINQPLRTTDNPRFNSLNIGNKVKLEYDSSSESINFNFI